MSLTPLARSQQGSLSGSLGQGWVRWGWVEWGPLALLSHLHRGKGELGVTRLSLNGLLRGIGNQEGRLRRWPSGCVDDPQTALSGERVGAEKDQKETERSKTTRAGAVGSRDQPPHQVRWAWSDEGRANGTSWAVAHSVMSPGQPSCTVIAQGQTVGSPRQ